MRNYSRLVNERHGEQIEALYIKEGLPVHEVAQVLDLPLHSVQAVLKLRGVRREGYMPPKRRNDAKHGYKAQAQRAERNAAIIRWASRGASWAELSRVYGLAERRLRLIVARGRALGLID